MLLGSHTEGHVPGVAGFPHFRVAIVVRDAVERAIDDHAALGGVGELVVVGLGEHLHLPVAIGVVVPVGPTMPGVVEAQLAVIANHCRTGEHAVFLLLERRGEHNRFAPPMQHVGRGNVSPVHGAPLSAVRVKLVEDMPAAFVVAQPVGVVDPSTVGSDMEQGVPAVVAGCGEFADARLRLFKLQCMVADGCEHWLRWSETGSEGRRGVLRAAGVSGVGHDRP